MCPQQYKYIILTNINTLLTDLFMYFVKLLKLDPGISQSSNRNREDEITTTAMLRFENHVLSK
jgi:hypothetical protein